MAVSTLGIVCIAFGALVSIVSVAVLCFAFYLHFFVHQKYKHIPGPPRKSFFLGNLPTMWEYAGQGKLFPDVVTDWTIEYGPIVAIYIVNRVLITTNSPESVKEFLISPKHPKSKSVYQGVSTVFGSRLMGTGLVTEVDHNIWSRKRAICDPAFRRKSMRSFMDDFNACADLLVQKLSKMADGKTEVVLLDEMNKLTLDIIAKVAFGFDLNLLSQEDSKFNKAVVTALEASDKSNLFPWIKYNPAPSVIKYRQEARKACRILREVGSECIQKRLQAKARGEAVPDDVLTAMMEANDRFEDFHNEVDWPHILDEFVTFFIAGQETTGNTLTFALKELCQHPEIMHRSRTEVEAVTGDHNDVQFEHLSQLPYTSAILKETLRLYPPSTVTLRDTVEDTTLHGIRIPKGSTVSISKRDYDPRSLTTNTWIIDLCLFGTGVQHNQLFSVHFESPSLHVNLRETVFTYTVSRLEQYFKDPLVFEPERFLREKEVRPNTYIPFSTGPRSCIGQQFAMIESRVLIAKLLKNFVFELVPDQSFQVIQEGTLKPKDRCKVYIKPRNGEYTDAIIADNKEG